MASLDAGAAIASLRELYGNIAAIARQGIAQAAAFAAALGRASSKFQTHRSDGLRSTIRSGSTGQWSAFASAGDRKTGGLAVFVEDGTRAHIIMPKAGAGFIGPTAQGQGRRSRGRGRTLLRFVVAGQVRFATKVHHPGTKPTHFMLDARNQAELELERRMTIALNNAIGR